MECPPGYAGDLERDTPAMTEPQSWVRVGASNLAGSDAALAEALQGLALEWTARLLVVLAAPHHNLEAVARELALELPQTAVIGCTTAGEIAGGRALSDALVLWALGGTGVRVQTGHGLGTGPELREAAQRAASCLETLERRAHPARILLSDGLGGDQMEVVRGAYDATGIDVP
ncbi:MAG: FIST N-terminal domain-containing protein, partial [Cyanobium sp.]